MERSRSPEPRLGRRSLLKSAATLAGALVLARGKSAAARPARAALTDVQVNCGFKGRGHDPSESGRALRDRLHRDALAALERARPHGWRAQLQAAEDVLERISDEADAAGLRELWLTVRGHVGGRYRERQYVSALG
jgi:hypothetical protein